MRGENITAANPTPGTMKAANDAARQLKLKHEIGSTEVGKYADFAVVGGEKFPRPIW